MSAPAVSSPEKLQPDHLHPEDQTLAQYTAVSRSAVLALFMGLASALMLVSPILVLVPLAAIAAAVVGLRHIGASGGQVTGRSLATLGLCLATLFLGWGFSREWTRQSKLRSDAQQLAEGWLKLVRDGQLQKAEQLMKLPDQRLSSDAAIADFYKNDAQAGKSLQELFTTEPMKSFVAMGPGGGYRLHAISSQSHRGFTDEVIFQYAFGDPLPAAGESRETTARETTARETTARGTTAERYIWVWVARTIDITSQIPGWRIDRIDYLPPPENR